MRRTLLLLSIVLVLTLLTGAFVGTRSLGGAVRAAVLVNFIGTHRAGRGNRRRQVGRRCERLRRHGRARGAADSAGLQRLGTEAAECVEEGIDRQADSADSLRQVQGSKFKVGRHFQF